MVALEAMVDNVGVRNVLYALAQVCFAKAEHLRTNWQDRTSAGTWNLMGNMVDRAAGAIAKRVGEG